MRKFTIEEEGHADFIGEYETFESAILELKRISTIPWNVEPNISPCSNQNCSRDYMINEFEVSNDSWKLIKNDFVLLVGPQGARWFPGFENC